MCNMDTLLLLSSEIIIEMVNNTLLFSSECINPVSLTRSGWKGLQQPLGIVIAGVKLYLDIVTVNSNPHHGEEA